ncbi:MAG: hypothetical protein JSR77_14750 [Planctomycetes bacterium]|nr:hypothetical protein [Planctomycetota bacterium]
MPEPIWRCLRERLVEKRSVQTIASEFDCDPKTMSRMIADAKRSCREVLTERELLNK